MSTRTTRYRSFLSLPAVLLTVSLTGCSLFGGPAESDFEFTHQTWSFDYEFPLLWEGVTSVLQDKDFPLARRADPTDFPAEIVSMLQEETTRLTDAVEFAQRAHVRIEQLNDAPETYRVGFAVVRLWREKGDGDDDWEPSEVNPDAERDLIRALRREMETRSNQRGL